MTAPDKNEGAKPLHERIEDYFKSEYEIGVSFSIMRSLLREAAEALRNAEERLAKARTALQTHGDHSDSCSIWTANPAVCNCGYSAALAALSTAKPAD